MCDLLSYVALLLLWFVMDLNSERATQCGKAVWEIFRALGGWILAVTTEQFEGGSLELDTQGGLSGCKLGTARRPRAETPGLGFGNNPAKAGSPTSPRD